MALLVLKQLTHSKNNPIILCIITNSKKIVYVKIYKKLLFSVA